MTSQWYRIFGSNEVEPRPAALLEYLRSMGRDVEGHFQGDDQGWFRAQLLLGNTNTFIERYLVSEEGIRAELNTWAAWVETTGDGAEQRLLMQRVICTQQLILLRDPPRAYADCLTGFLARLTDGVYQIDGCGFYSADGTLLVSEEQE
jgi:hypothetical protein